MKSYLFIILFTTTLFASTTTNKQVTSTNQKVIVMDDFDDDFDDEFNENGTDIEVYDPLSGYNRTMTSFNDFVYIDILNPVATGYSNVVHKDIRKGISNVFENLFFPIRFVNNVLQLKFQNATDETVRFLVNSTFGLLGIFDPALDELNIEPHKEDFGQTLGFYGVGPGPHIVLPFFGPSNLRDTVSMIPDSILNPTTEYFPNSSLTTTESVLIYTGYSINKTSLHLGEYESLKKDALDIYTFLRDSYEQKRIKEIEE